MTRWLFFLRPSFWKPVESAMMAQARLELQFGSLDTPQDF